MKSTYGFGLGAIAVAGVVMLAGCATEEISIDYVKPARQVADVKSVNVAEIRVNANVRGSLAGDNKKNAELVRQLLASRLYKEGYYTVVDSINGSAEGAKGLSDIIKETDPGHGYASFTAVGQGTAKVVIDLDLDMTLDAKPVTKEMDFTLVTVPFEVKQGKDGKPPTSKPLAAVPQVVKQPVTVWELAASGTLKASFSGPANKSCPVEYANTFEIAVPEDGKFDSAVPSQLKALASVVTPAVNEVVADISPYKETRTVVASGGGNEGVVFMLNAKAFSEVVTMVESLEEAGAAEAPDFENLGIAFEATGDFYGAKSAYEKALAADPSSTVAQDGVARVDDALAGKKDIKASGAKENKDIQFKK